MKFYSLLLLATSSIVISTNASAQDRLILQKLTELDAAAPMPPNEVLEREVLAAASLIYGSQGTCANSSVNIHQVQPATATPYVIDSVVAGKLRNAWTVQALIAGCDRVSVRFLVLQSSDETLRTIRVNRGNSYAWDRLIADTLPLAQVAAWVALKRADIECDKSETMQLGEFRIQSEEADLGKDTFGVRFAGSWSEIWPVNYCGKQMELTIEFRADGVGGAYNSVPSEKISILP